MSAVRQWQWLFFYPNNIEICDNVEQQSSFKILNIGGDNLAKVDYWDVYGSYGPPKVDSYKSVC